MCFCAPQFHLYVLSAVLTPRTPATQLHSPHSQKLRIHRTYLLKQLPLRPTEIYTPLLPCRPLNHMGIMACPLSDLTPSKPDDRSILEAIVFRTLHSVVRYFCGWGFN